MGWYLSPRYNHVILDSEYLFWQLLIYHKMDVPTLARKCDILHWLPYGADGLMEGHVTNQISRMNR